MFGTSSIINIATTQDTPLADSSDAFSKCRPAQPRDLPFRLREAPRPTAFRFRRTLPDHPHMQLSRDLATINNHADTVIVAVCVSLGGIGIVAIAIYAIMMRRRQKILDAQDTAPRPFEVAVPAVTTLMITRDLTSPPTLGVPRRIYSQSRGRSRFSARIKRSASAPTTAAPSQPGPSRNTRKQPLLPDTSLLTNHAGPSSYRAPPRSSTHLLTAIPPDPQPQSDSRVQPEQSSSSFPMGAQRQRTAGVSASRSASVREQHSAKYALWLSRSASELYGATPSDTRHRLPEYSSHDPLASWGRYYAQHRDEGELHVDTLLRSTKYLRQWHSASPVVHVQRARSEEEVEVAAAPIFQRPDASVVQELPPPYQKLTGSGANV